MKKITIALTFIASLFLLPTFAQDDSKVEEKDTLKRELGFRGYSLTSLTSLIYRRQNKKGNYLRMSGRLRAQLDNSNISFDTVNLNNNYNFINPSFALSFEKRKLMKNKLYLLHGLSTGIGINYNYDGNKSANISANTSSSNLLESTLRVGYIIGLNYKLNKDFNFGVEIVPSASYTFSYEKSRNQRPSLSSDITTIQIQHEMLLRVTNNAAFVLTYNL